jgi:hypothetical protein
MFRSDDRHKQVEDQTDFDIHELEDIDGLTDALARRRKHPRNLDLEKRIPRV